MIWARVEGGTVAVISLVEPADLTGWQTVPDDTLAGDTVADGVVTRPAAPTLVPQAVSAFQAKEALRAAGLLALAEAAVTASGDAKAILAWQTAGEFQRNSATIASLAPALSLEPADIDALFITAAGITA